MATQRQNHWGFVRVGIKGQKGVSCLGLAMAKFPVFRLGLCNPSPPSLTGKQPKGSKPSLRTDIVSDQTARCLVRCVEQEASRTVESAVFSVDC